MTSPGVVAAGVSSCLTTRMSDTDMTAYFAGGRYLPKRQFYQTTNRKMHYVEAGNDTLPPVLFVHGSIVQAERDVLVPADNARFAVKKLKHLRVTTIFKDNMNHFVPWSDPDLIVEGILRAAK